VIEQPLLVKFSTNFHFSGRIPMEMKAAKILQRMHLKLKQLLQKEAVAAPVKRVQALMTPMMNSGLIRPVPVPEIPPETTQSPPQIPGISLLTQFPVMLFLFSNAISIKQCGFY
jgi:hypothetical protein